MHNLIILQCQPLAEQDWLLDAFTHTYGRLKLVLRRPQYYPDLLVQYQGVWQASNDWPVIKAWQSVQNWPLEQHELYCALYLNELLTQLLPPNEPFPQLYERYQASLQALADNQWPEPWLRLFEWQLLTALGYGFSWQQDSQSLPLQPNRHYQFELGAGFVASEQGFLGQDLLAFAQGSKELKVWRVAKQVLRQALDTILPRPLVSRELFIKV